MNHYHTCLKPWIPYLLLTGMVFGLGTFWAAAQKIPADSARVYIRSWVNELRAKHPGFYRYHSPQDFDRYIDSTTASITEPVTEPELYRVLKPLVSRIGCLHTGIDLPGAYTDSLDRLPNLLPLQLYFTGGRAFIIKNFSADSTLIPGAEVMYINGKSIPDLLRVLLPAIPSDGYIQTMKYRALYHLFPLWYRSMVEVTENYQIITRHQGTTRLHTVPGKKYDDLAQNGFLKEFIYPHPLEFSITDGIGRLSIHTFANSDIRAAKQRFKPFIKAAFDALHKQSVQNLVLDLRYNTGGSDDNAAHLARYFFDTPYRYWDRIEVTEAIAQEIKGVYRIFYRKPLHKDSLWLWQKGKTVSDFDYYETQYPVKNPYKGNVYVLINGFCMSSCADLTAILFHHKRAIFIGEETGGGYQGNTSGMMPQTTLLPTKLRLTVPLQKYVTAVNPTQNIERGTLPHYAVEPSVESLIRNEDEVLTATFALIKSRNP